tara:strand:+ start:11559 stop:12260 length:702 start_codon:yes stop_codon:yes gene_type:complete
MNDNIDQNEINKFADIADKWWDPSGEFKPLHIINPVRAKYIAERCNIKGLNILDVGCGGGLLSEALYDMGAIVTGIDVSERNINIANIHSKKHNKKIKYYKVSSDDLIKEKREFFDVVTCLEVVEHVPDPKYLVQNCSDLLKPNGHMFLSTINRNPRSFITAILGAEYIFNVLPQGTHEYHKFLKPSELASFMMQAKIRLEETKGLFYNPIFHKAKINDDLGVNYMIHGIKND